MNFIDIILDTIHDTWAMLPLLYITYCILLRENFKNKMDLYSKQKKLPYNFTYNFL